MQEWPETAGYRGQLKGRTISTRIWSRETFATPTGRKVHRGLRWQHVADARCLVAQSHSSSRGRCVPRAVSLSNMCWISDFLLWLQEPLLQEHHGPTVGFWVLWAGTGQGRSVLTLSVLSRLSSSWRLTTTSMLTCTRLWCWPDDTPALCSTWATGSSSVQSKEVWRSRWDLTDNISGRLDYSRSEIYQIWDWFCVWKTPYFIKTQGKARNASIRGALSSIFMA